jgi:ABC-type branched-subunit amino acid transport system permease subunit
VALLVMVLVAFPAGFLLTSRTHAYMAYIAVHAPVFAFQSLALLIDWAGGDEAAFGPFPASDQEKLWGYGALNLVIYVVGLGLVSLGYYTRQWLRRRRSGSVSLDPVG